MKTINQILIILLMLIKDGKLRQNAGLCWLTSRAWDMQLISSEEYYLMIDYLENNPPYWFRWRNKYGFQEWFGHSYNYFWRRGNSKARAKWVRKHIKLTKDS